MLLETLDSVTVADTCSDINENELMNPRRLESLLNEAQAYEQHLMREKEKLRQRLGLLSSILSKAQ